MMTSPLRHEALIKKLYQRPSKTEHSPRVKIPYPNVFQQVDVLYLQPDRGYKYLLVLVDVGSKAIGARPLRTMAMPPLIRELERIYRESPHLDYPQVLQGDNQFRDASFRAWCESHGIRLKLTEPDEHTQQAHVEGVNKMIGTALWKRQVDREIETGRPIPNGLKSIRR